MKAIRPSENLGVNTLERRESKMKILCRCVGEIGTNCYIVYDEESKEAAVIDPGDEGAAILEIVTKKQLQVKYVMLTHGHYDHVLGAHDILAATHAQYVVPKKDKDMLSETTLRRTVPSYIEDAPDVLATEGTELMFGNLRAVYMHTPGHTQGSSVIQIEECLFTGDTLFKHDCGRCDLEGGSYPQMLKSLKRLHDLAGDYQVLPGHDDFSTLEEERRCNGYMAEGVAVAR